MGYQINGSYSLETEPQALSTQSEPSSACSPPRGLSLCELDLPLMPSLAAARFQPSPRLGLRLTSPFAPPSNQSPSPNSLWPHLQARPGPVSGWVRPGPTPGPPRRRCAAAGKAPPAVARNCGPESFPQRAVGGSGVGRAGPSRAVGRVGARPGRRTAGWAAP